MCLDCSPHRADPRDHRPSAAELAESAALDAFAAQRRADQDAATRAAGGYVPDPATALLGSSLMLALPGVTVVPVRRLTYRLDGWDAAAPRPVVTGFEFAVTDGTAWARAVADNPLAGDPFKVDAAPGR